MAARVSGRFDFPRLPGLICKGERMVKRSFLKDADINFIMKKYQKSGLLVDPLNPGSRRPMFGDFSNVGDFHALSGTIARVDREFGSLPASLRNRFGNDPHLLIEFLADSKNDEEAFKLGLKVRPKAEPKPPVAPPAPPAAPPGPVIPDVPVIPASGGPAR